MDTPISAAIWLDTVAFCFFFSSRRRHTRWNCDWSSDVCSSDLLQQMLLTEAERRCFSQLQHVWIPPHDAISFVPLPEAVRSEERRVGKECRSRGSGCRYRKSDSPHSLYTPIDRDRQTCIPVYLS